MNNSSAAPEPVDPPPPLLIYPLPFRNEKSMISIALRALSYKVHFFILEMEFIAMFRIFKLKDYWVLFLIFLAFTGSDPEAIVDETIPPGTIVKDSSGIEMVYIPVAVFVMGIDKDKLLTLCKARGEDLENCVRIIEEDTGATYTYTVDIPAFWMDRYEITIEQFLRACTANYLWFPQGCIDRHLPPELMEKPDQPQVNISYLDALAFCGTRNARLPTEVEWEYAASGPDKLNFPWGNDFNPDYVHLSDDTYPPSRTYPVGSIPENKSWVGIYDMAGNAAEWVEDRFLPHLLKDNILDEVYSANRSHNADVRRVLRGGSWDGRPWPMTTFYRESQPMNATSEYTGFRCAQYVHPQS